METGIFRQTRIVLSSSRRGSDHGSPRNLTTAFTSELGYSNLFPALPIRHYPLTLLGAKMAKLQPRTAKKFLLKGRVQGVGFRYFAERWASQLGICGYVKNLWDGDVEVYAIGDVHAIEELKRQLAEGPRSAHVTSMDESDERVDERYHRFMIENSLQR